VFFSQFGLRVQRRAGVETDAKKRRFGMRAAKQALLVACRRRPPACAALPGSALANQATHVTIEAFPPGEPMENLLKKLDLTSLRLFVAV
jgi:hypothetical protein